MPRAKQRTPELRDRIVEAAMEMLAADGPGSLTARSVALNAETSVPAIYELFGDKGGLIRHMFFEGFRLLRREFDALSEREDPRADLQAALDALKTFSRENPQLFELMFSNPVADFTPVPEDIAAGKSVRTFLVGKVDRCIKSGALNGNATDIAHALMALVQGLALQEAAGWMGSSRTSINRRWQLAVSALLDGLAPNRGR